MKKFYVVKLNYKKQKEGGELGQIISITEKFLVEATGISDAEAKITKWIPNNYIDPVIKGVTASQIEEVILDWNKENYYLCRVAEESETKPKYYYIIIDANSMVEAAQKLTGQLKNSIGNYLINSITVSKLLIEYGLIEYDENKIPEDIKEKRKIGFELKNNIEDNKNLLST
jgi:hypothetical protein